MIEFIPMTNLPSSDLGKVRKRNRLRKQTPKKHEIKNISGRSTLRLQEHIINKSKSMKRK